MQPEPILLPPRSRVTGWQASVLIAILLLVSPEVAYAQTGQQTVPRFRPVANWLFAEGSTQTPFETWFLVQNPTNQTANVRFTFQIQAGGTVTRDFTVGPTSRFSLFANQALPDQAFSTRIDADQAIFAERSVFAGFDGTVVPGISAPDRTWLFAEGSTQNPFHTWLLLQNPNDQPATATITYLVQGGAPVSQVVALPPDSRTSVFVNEVLPNAAFSLRVESSLPIVAERSMFRFPGNAATAKPGVNAPGRTWYFADGRSFFPPGQGGQGADTWLLLQNPNSTAVTATITAFSREGRTATFERVLPPTSRQSIHLNVLRELSTIGIYGIQVQASGDIIAERSVYVHSPATGWEPFGAYSTIGATRLGTAWLFPEGSTAPPFGEFIALLNPNDQTMAAHFEFMLSSGQVVTHDVTVPPSTHFEVDVGAVVSNAAVSTRVTTSLPSVAERIMSIARGGNVGYHDALGIGLQ